jgi:hypothetical protein
VTVNTHFFFCLIIHTKNTTHIILVQNVCLLATLITKMLFTSHIIQITSIRQNKEQGTVDQQCHGLISACINFELAVYLFRSDTLIKWGVVGFLCLFYKFHNDFNYYYDNTQCTIKLS